MTISALASPSATSDTYELVDWLELAAFFDRFGEGRLDQIDGALKMQEEDQEEDFGQEDSAREELRSKLEAEIDFRSSRLGRAYPFELSPDGEVLRMKHPSNRRGATFYTLCLVLSHVTRSAVLVRRPSDENLRDVRKRHFQILSTLAVGGHGPGGSVSLGWPRESGESILSVVKRACSGAGTGKARLAPASTANKHAKDGGIDVLGWTPENDRPPPKTFTFAQAASGHKWDEKSATGASEKFRDDYFDEHPQCEYSHVTICPFRLSNETIMSSSKRHGVILDRTRAPHFALIGLDRAASHGHVDEAENVCRLTKWLANYRREVRQAA